MRGVLACILFMLPGIISIHAQIDFQCRVDSNQMLIGDQRMLTLQISGLASGIPDNVSFKSWQDLGVEPIDSQRWQSAGANSYAQQLTISAFDTGYIKLPPLAVSYGSNGMDTAWSNDLVLEVHGITVDSTGLAPIKPILREPYTFRDFLPYLAVIGLGILAFLIIYFRTPKEKQEEVVVEVPLPPHETALTDLEALKSKKLWQQGKIKAYQSELTHIIRAYIEGRYKMPALESTTTEILEFEEMKNLETSLRNDLDQILNMADLIKFAKATPSIDIHEKFMTQAIAFVRATQQREENIDD